MPTMSLLKALNSALACEMERDGRIVVLGEDVGKLGGVFRVTEGLQERFGQDRCFDTPLCEQGIVGAAIGMALGGLVPVAEIQFMDYILPAYDQIANELATLRYRSGGQSAAPVVVRTPACGGIGGGHFHSQSTEAIFTSVPGLKVAMPSDPYDAKGLLVSALRGEDPVLFIEPKKLYRAARAEVPEESYTVPFGEARTLREGHDVTVVAWGVMAHVAADACERVATRRGIQAELIDPRTLVPLDEAAIVASVRRTGRLVIVHEARRSTGFGAELSALVQEEAFLHLEAPIRRVTGFDVHFPYRLDPYFVPDLGRIARAIEETARY